MDGSLKLGLIVKMRCMMFTLLEAFVFFFVRRTWKKRGCAKYEFNETVW